MRSDKFAWMRPKFYALIAHPTMFSLLIRSLHCAL
jgi:hypothetical protein